MHIDEKHLSDIASRIREQIVRMLSAAGSGHAAGSLGMADVFTALYFSDVLELKPREPLWEERDRVILSAGHICPVWYATLAEAGYFDTALLETLRSLGSPLQGHPHRMQSEMVLPGVENSAGPLGQGVSVAVGMALGLKLKHSRGELRRLPRVICVSSDGEQQEGQVWEAYMSASKYGLENLTFIIDRNNIQIDGVTQVVMPLEPLKNKLESFGLFVIEVDGHSFESVVRSLLMDESVHGKPVAIIARTIPGKGVDFMENRVEWHGKAPVGVGEAAEALQEIKKLRSLDGEIRSEYD